MEHINETIRNILSKFYYYQYPLHGGDSQVRRHYREEIARLESARAHTTEKDQPMRPEERALLEETLLRAAWQVSDTFNGPVPDFYEAMLALRAVLSRLGRP